MARIGIVSEYARPWPGGISEHVHHEAVELGSRGHEVTIVTGSGAVGERTLQLGRAITFTSNGARSRLTVGRYLFQLPRLLGRFDVLHVHAPLDPLLGIASVLAAPCRVVGTFHASLPPSRGWELLYGHRWARAASRRLAGRIAVSCEARRSIERQHPGDYEIIPNGVDTDRFAPSPPPRRRRILFVGRADPRKGLPLLMDAFERLRARAADVTLDLVGVEGLPPRPGVRCHGVVAADAMPRHYAACDVFCSPATGRESQGVVLLEAMASARPVVCFDIPGYREVVEDGASGCLARELSAAALADGIERALATPGLGETGRRIACERYTWREVGGQIERVLLRALGR